MAELRAPEQPDDIDDKVYAVLFASWRDGSWWVGEAHGNDGFGTHVLCFSGRGEQCESANRADAKDRAPVAQGVHFLAAQRAAEVERRLPTDGPPTNADAVIVESGDPAEMQALLAKRERAWQRVGSRQPNALWLMPLGFGLPSLAGILHSLIHPFRLSFEIPVLAVCLGFAAGPLLMLVQSWQVKHLRQKTWRNGPPTPVLWSLLTVNVAVFALELLWGGSDSALTLYRMGAGLGRAGLAHEAWRMVSAAFLHVGFLHLSMNMWSLLVLGRMLESVLGSRRFVFLYALSAAAGGFASAVVHPRILSAGASGAVWGLMTAHIAMVLRLRHQEGAGRMPVPMKRLLLPLLVNLLISLIPGVDMAAHLGGGAAGAALVLSGLVEWRRPEGSGWRPAAWGASLAMAACLVAALCSGRPWELRHDPNVYYNRGIARGAKGDLDGALADYTEAIRLKPDHACAYNNRGNARGAKGDLDGALADYSEAVRLKSDDPDAYYNRALLWRRKQGYRAAIADFEKYLQLGGGQRDGDQAEVEGMIRDLKRRLP